jgi:hypothetical protein
MAALLKAPLYSSGIKIKACRAMKILNAFKRARIYKQRVFYYVPFTQIKSCLTMHMF